MDSENTHTAMFDALKENQVSHPTEVPGSSQSIAPSSHHKRNKSNLMSKSPRSPLMRQKTQRKGLGVSDENSS